MVGSVPISAENVNPSASTSWMSCGFSRGDGGVDRITEGMRVWPRFFAAAAAVDDDVSTESSAGGS